MVATNDDILNALNKLIELQTPKITPISEFKRTILHDGVIVELDKESGKYNPVLDIEVM